MKLSEAMLIGIAATAPCSFTMCSEDGSETCALGAVYYGYYGRAPIVDRDDEDAVMDDIIAKMPRLDIATVTFPDEDLVGAHSNTIAGFLGCFARLNDRSTGRWSREKIAAWLAAQGL